MCNVYNKHWRNNEACKRTTEVKNHPMFQKEIFIYNLKISPYKLLINCKDIEE